LGKSDDYKLNLINKLLGNLNINGLADEMVLDGLIEPFEDNDLNK
jgi:hypothetical protein